MAITSGGSGGWCFFARLVRNEAGNVLMLTAALLIPLTALIGSGIDLGRIYVARERMQVACDAASLAGRRAVSANLTSDQISAEATKFFNYNFPQLSYGTAAFTPAVSVSTDTKQIVTVTAATTLPMSLMTIFGFTSEPISVTCNAQQNFVNTDIVLVLDVTGSMLCTPSQTSCSNSNETSSSKIVAMRSAVLALYDALSSAQTQLEAAGLRLRYALVPYSSTVNVGKSVYALNAGYIQSQPSYWQNVCTGSGYNRSCSNQFVPISSPHPANWYTSSSWGGCVEEASTVSTITTSSGFSIPSGANDMNVDLVPTLGTSSAAMATQWAPFDPTTESSSAYSDSSPCTTAQAKPLQAWDSRDDLNTYLTSLKASGGTMSDEGLVWGGRMLSQTGIWAALNPATFGNMPVNRFVILMTDGGITAYKSYYAAYGIENLDHRVDGSPYPCASTQAGAECVADSHIHRQRFAMICNEIKNAGTSIWAIGFGTSLSDADDLAALQNCATNTGQFAYITDSASLTAKFTAIGQAIGALRLTQ